MAEQFGCIDLLYFSVLKAVTKNKRNDGFKWNYTIFTSLSMGSAGRLNFVFEAGCAC